MLKSKKVKKSTIWKEYHLRYVSVFEVSQEAFVNSLQSGLLVWFLINPQNAYSLSLSAAPLDG